MPSNDFIVHPCAEVQGESVSAIGVLLPLIQNKGALLPPLGWGKQFLMQIHMELLIYRLGICLGGCAGRWFVPNCKGPGKLGVLGSCGQG